ncbi:MAG: ankyrin repeat domain-containing protein [Pseudomonadota bacterium]|uniref:Ankyrin repeat protein n=1 Tax=hydrothermal vent metagenome TaxID=652676 RepID=A0A160TJF6_9ZZZZ
MAKKKKLLPKDFEALLEQGDLDRLKAVFDTCELDARGGVFKQTALAFASCPDDLARWLAEQGADISAGDTYGETPLHSRARSWQGRIGVLLDLGADVNRGEGGRGTPLHGAAAGCHMDNVRQLLEHGAHVDALDEDGFTPLEHALQRCSNAQIERMAPLAAALLDAGARTTKRTRDFVTRIGTDFEFHRANFNQESRDAASAALDRLYALFDVPPVPRRATHDGRSPIVATADRWQDRHQQLWALLVPSSGAAATVQGEVIRISGRIADELDGNGGANWDAQYRAMADAWLAHVGSGKALPGPELHSAAQVIAEVKQRTGDARRLCELAVAWVTLNPGPVALSPPSYHR